MRQLLVSSEVRRHEGRGQEAIPPQHNWGGCPTFQAAAYWGRGTRPHPTLHCRRLCREFHDKLQKYHSQPCFKRQLRPPVIQVTNFVTFVGY